MFEVLYFLSMKSVHHVCAVLVKVRSGCLIPQNWSHRALQATMWMLGIESRSSVGVEPLLAPHPPTHPFYGLCFAASSVDLDPTQ